MNVDTLVWRALAEIGGGLHGTLDGFVIDSDPDDGIIVLAFEAGFHIHR